MPEHRSPRRASRFVAPCALLAVLGCASTPPQAGTSPGASPSPAAKSRAAASRGPTTTVAGKYSGKVLGADGKPAGNVLVRAYAVGDNGNAVIGNNGGAVIGNNGGAIIGNNGGSIIGLNSSGLIGTTRYRLAQAASEVRTAADGTFRLVAADGRPLNLEAVAADDLKAFAPGVTTAKRDLVMRLAPTGRIAGRVRAEDTGVSNLVGVQVFIPGTSYLAITDAAGRYAIENVPVGTFNLVAIKAGPGTGGAADVLVASRTTTTAPDIVLIATRPLIWGVEPPNALPGMKLTLRGENFGRTTGAPLSVTVGGLLVPDAVALDDQTIALTVPEMPGASGFNDAPPDPDAIRGPEAREIVVSVGGVACPAPYALQVYDGITVYQPGRGEPVRWMRPGQSQALAAALLEGDGEPLEVTWSIFNYARPGAPDDGSVTLKAGRLEALRPGVFSISARSGNRSAGFTVRVTDDPYLIATDRGPWATLAREVANRYIGFQGGEPGLMETSPSPGLEAPAPPGLETPPRAPGGPTSRAIAVGPFGMGDVFAFLGKEPAPPSGSPTPSARIAGLVFAGPRIAYGVDAARHLVATFEPERNAVFAGTGRAGFANGPAAQAAFNAPADITFGGDFLVVADRGNERIRRITLSDPTHPVTTLAGDGTAGFADGPRGKARFNAPGAVVIDALGNVLVADTNNHRIRKITPAGVVTTLAGSGEAGYVDGAASVARFDRPLGLALDARGVLYVADSGNDRIRKVDPTGNVSSFDFLSHPEAGVAGGPSRIFTRPRAVRVDDALGHLLVVDGEGKLHAIVLAGHGGVVPEGSFPAAPRSAFEPPLPTGLPPGFPGPLSSPPERL